MSRLSICVEDEGSSGFGSSLKLTMNVASALQVLRFVHEWSSLAAMKKKLLRRSGLLFHSPTLGLQQLASARRPHSSTKRSDPSWKCATLTFKIILAVIQHSATNLWCAEPLLEAVIF